MTENNRLTDSICGLINNNNAQRDDGTNNPKAAKLIDRKRIKWKIIVISYF